MKPILFILSVLFCGKGIGQAQQIDSVHKKKAEWIIERVASGKPMPEGIKDHSKAAQRAWGSHYYSLSYKTMRMENGQATDSFYMGVDINSDLRNLEFHEDRHFISKGINAYHYNIEKGEITHAYATEDLPDSLKKEPVYHKDGSVAYPMNTKTDSSLVVNKKDSLWTYDKAELEKHKERDRKAEAFYLPKLLYSIDELYGLLNQK